MPTDLPNEHVLRDPGSIQLDPQSEGVAIDETKRLIASNKVEGTAVYDRQGERLGSVYTRIPHMDRVGGPQAHRNVGETADSFFHPSRPSGFGCPVHRKRLI